jgi:hypothetical protein
MSSQRVARIASESFLEALQTYSIIDYCLACYPQEWITGLSIIDSVVVLRCHSLRDYKTARE